MDRTYANPILSRFRGGVDAPPYYWSLYKIRPSMCRITSPLIQGAVLEKIGKRFLRSRSDLVYAIFSCSIFAGPSNTLIIKLEERNSSGRTRSNHREKRNRSGLRSKKMITESTFERKDYRLLEPPIHYPQLKRCVIVEIFVK